MTAKKSSTASNQQGAASISADRSDGRDARTAPGETWRNWRTRGAAICTLLLACLFTINCVRAQTTPGSGTMSAPSS
ncbi:MAG TPA: hypothetical protein VN754_12045, partial [Candidatus Binataceae bacterium]|nr:hypothetical protein [Candidatus Binataceae bacterium]